MEANRQSSKPRFSIATLFAATTAVAVGLGVVPLWGTAGIFFLAIMLIMGAWATRSSANSDQRAWYLGFFSTVLLWTILAERFVTGYCLYLAVQIQHFVLQTGQPAWIWDVTEVALGLAIPGMGQALVAGTLGIFGGILFRAMLRWRRGKLPRLELDRPWRLSVLIAASCLFVVPPYLVLLYFSAPPNFDPERARLYGEWSLATVLCIAFVVFLLVSWLSLRRCGLLATLICSLSVAVFAWALVNGVVVYRFGKIAPWNDILPWGTQPLLLLCPQVFTAVACLVTALATAITTRVFWGAVEGLHQKRSPLALHMESSQSPVPSSLSHVS